MRYYNIRTKFLNFFIMDYSVDSLYDVMKHELEASLDFSSERRFPIINAIAFEVDPFNCEYDIAVTFKNFIVDVGVVLATFGIKKENKHMELSLELATLFVYDHIRERDLHFISEVRRLTKEKGL